MCSLSGRRTCGTFACAGPAIKKFNVGITALRRNSNYSAFISQVVCG